MHSPSAAYPAGGAGTVLGKDYWGSGHLACIRDFYRAIAENRPYQNDISSVRNTMALMLHLYAGVRGKKVAAE